ncbi:dTDP-glucose 4,6-dehydratase [Streptomyces tagetis]|uniref:dTDP-glucose 4,6-dehydratase n=1 Tax=Streptomyces tagetis TaxID=2820809 RepID=A0A940XJN4_9ACTN|nr:dTDP-glucose 4,6-dehydratase [Streptomyces sp. RG38]MBQ0825053.1 dTDP-glucose 4,6-dehydratase [Streptomyces sp. RG38]
MRLLITGGAGFIGSHFVRRLLDGSVLGHETTGLTVLDKLTYAGNTGNLPLDHPRLRLVRGDVCDRRLLLDLLPGHDAVVHFAAESHVDRSIEDASLFARTNVVGTQTLLDSCLRTGVRRVVHVSTDEVYGSIDEGSWTEDHSLLPNSPYAASKAGSDLMARAYWRTHGLEVSVTRCANNYGPYQHPEKLIPRFVTGLLDGRRLPLYGDGAHRREWIHVNDHCRAVQLVLEKGAPGAAYNIGGTELSNRDLTGRLLRLCGAEWDRVTPVTDRKGHDRRYSVDATRIRDELGFEPAIPFDQGIAGTVRWYREHRPWWEPLTEPHEEAR